MKRRSSVILGWLFLVLLLQCSAGKKTGMATELLLVDGDGKEVALREVTGNGASVLVYLASECPISQKYCKTLRELAADYPDIALVGVFTRWEQVADMERFGKDYELNFPLLLDREHKLLATLGVTVTPEAFLLDEQGQVLYRGAVDNWFYALGRNRPFPTENYLRDAIEAYRNGLPVPVAATEAVGCVIERE